VQQDVSSSGDNPLACDVNSPAGKLKIGTSLNGYLSDLRIYPQALNAVQVKEIMENKASVDTGMLPVPESFSCHAYRDVIEITQKTEDSISIKIYNTLGVPIHALTTNDMCSAFHLHDRRGVYLVFIRSERSGERRVYRLME
jgi:hypothetical protein